VSVADVAGPVGLMTPHVLRLLVGADHRRLLPAVLLGGPLFVVLADLAARTALVDASFFLWLLRHELGRAAGFA
ncbi:MAG: iron chelate uptake ABC transporter family permease subunit, partial [Actinomycetota bacterium]